MDYNQLDAIIRKKMSILFFIEVHFQLYDAVYKKVRHKNLPRKLLTQRNYPLEVIEQSNTAK